MTATSPDGRRWEIDAVREHASFGKSKGEPFFWAGVVATVLLVAVVVVFAFISTLVAIAAGLLLLVWLAERISNLLRPQIRARTEGPPPQEIVWKAGRLGRKGLEEKVARAIEAGKPEVEPPGLTLLHY